MGGTRCMGTLRQLYRINTPGQVVDAVTLADVRNDVNTASHVSKVLAAEALYGQEPSQHRGRYRHRDDVSITSGGAELGERARWW